MARFDIFKNEGGAGYLLDVQTNLLSGLNTRVVVPLLPKASAPFPAQKLNPVFSVGVLKAYLVRWPVSGFAETGVAAAGGFDALIREL